MFSAEPWSVSRQLRCQSFILVVLSISVIVVHISYHFELVITVTSVTTSVPP